MALSQQNEESIARRHFTLAVCGYVQALDALSAVLNSLEATVEHMEGNGGWTSVIPMNGGVAHEG